MIGRLCGAYVGMAALDACSGLGLMKMPFPGCQTLFMTDLFKGLGCVELQASGVRFRAAT